MKNSPKNIKENVNISGFCDSSKCIFKSPKFISGIRIVAKVLSAFSIVFLLGSIITMFFPEEGDEGFKTIELIALIFFPIGVLIGLIITWKKEKLGAIISLVSMFIFYLLIIVPRGAWRAMPITLLIVSPGVIYIFNYLILKDKR